MAQARRAQRSLPRHHLPRLPPLLHHRDAPPALSSPTSSSSTTTCSSPTSPSSSEATGAPDAGILPEAAAVVFDEAHELEEVASSYFGLSVSNIRFEELARDTDVLLRGKPGAEKLPAATQQLRDRARMFFAGLPTNGDGRQPFDNREEFLETSGDLYLAVRTTLRLLESEMELLTDIDEAPGLRKRVARLRTELEFLLESNSSNMVYWLERRAGPQSAGSGALSARLQVPATILHGAA